jgi:hypothetical protein
MTFEESNRAKTRRRREKRATATIEVTFGEKTPYECPECGHETKIGIYGAEFDEPSFLPCSAWDCDAFLKFVDDGDRSSEAAGGQANLAQFAGGSA